MLHRIQDRFPTQVLLWPVLVQGEKAAEQVSEAIDGMNALKDKPDVLIVARGGGSVEDLWPFNEEVVVRAAFRSEIPLISAIGHETDFTLLDFVADYRAPTPTAAAERAVPVLLNITATLRSIQNRLEYALAKYFEYRHNKLLMLKKSLPNYQTILLNFVQRLDDLSIRLINSSERFTELRFNRLNNYALRLKHPKDAIKLIETKFLQFINCFQRAGEILYQNNQQKLKLASSLLDSYSYRKTLNRGFVILNKKESPLTSATQATAGDSLVAEFHDGKLNLIVD